MKHKTTFKQNGEEKIIKEIKLNTHAIQLEEIEQGVYSHVFQKSLSNIRTQSELLPLTADVAGLAPSTYTLENDMIEIRYYARPNSIAFSSFANSKLHEKLQVLKNISYVDASFKKGYTHILHPNNLFVDDNNVPYVLYRGYLDVMEPLLQDEDDLIRQYQSLIFSLMDTKHDFEGFYNGALEFTKKTAFLEKVYNAKTIEEIATIVEDSYHKEKEKYEKKHLSVVKGRYRAFQNFGIIGSIFALVMSVALGWVLLVKVPYDDRMAKASSYYAAEQYGDVISTLSHDELSSLPQAQRYMLAKSYLERESMSSDNKNEAKKVFSYNSDYRIFEFWVKLGRNDYKAAIAIAKDMGVPAYGYIATFKALQIIADSTGNGEQKEKDLETYKKELAKFEDQMKNEKRKNESLPTASNTKTA